MMTGYRDHEIDEIFKNCLSIPELEKACSMLRFLMARGEQENRLIITFLRNIRLKELRKNIL